MSIATANQVMDDASAAASSASPYDVSARAALHSIQSHTGPVLVDLDETLYLRNSTEDFIDLARPATLALLLLQLLEIIKPWRWTGGEPTRDVWRVRLIRLVFPWTPARWRARCSGLAQQFGNTQLLEVLRKCSPPPTIVTVGFSPIARPLVAALGLPDSLIVAASLNTFADRRDGKLQIAIRDLGEQAVRQALVLTDSLQDLSLLEACACPLRTLWPEAHYRPALSGAYLPGQYISRVKRPGEYYFRRAILQEDFAFWILSSVALTPTPLHHCGGLLLLLCSFWIVYERGYVDNDLMAVKLERDPKLSAAFYRYPIATPIWQPWIWSSVCAVAGIALLRSSLIASPSDYLRWAGVLVGTYLWFLFYNRSPKPARVWMFSVLQLARAAAFTVLVPILPIGAMALGAHTLARWTPYHLYRMQGKPWPGAVQVGMMRVLFFVVLAALLGIAEGAGVVLNWTAAAILIWSLFRARHEIEALCRTWSAARKSRAFE